MHEKSLPTVIGRLKVIDMITLHYPLFLSQKRISSGANYFITTFWLRLILPSFVMETLYIPAGISPELIFTEDALPDI